LTGFLHYHFGAIHPFLPDPSDKPTYAGSETWRPSQLPHYDGESPADLDVAAMKPPYLGHRWLPISTNEANESIDLLRTPMGRAQETGDFNFSLAWTSWAVATQQHYSLLKNLEDNTVSRYHFGGGYDDLWDTQFVRYNLNFIAIWGKDVRENLPVEADDEKGLSVTIPMKTGRAFMIDTKAVVAHMHFGPQTKGVVETDLLDRWRAYANEQVCDAGNRKLPMDGRCDGFQ